MELSAEMENKIKELVRKEVSNFNVPKEQESVLFIFEVTHNSYGDTSRNEVLMYFEPGTCPSRFLIEGNLHKECDKSNPYMFLEKFGAKTVSIRESLALRPSKIYNFKVSAIDFDDNNGCWGTRIRLQ